MYWKNTFTQTVQVFGWVLLLSMKIAPASAQWAEAPDRRIPRTADGKPNLSAPAPKLANGKPSMAGLWIVDDNKLQFNLMSNGPEIPLQSEAAQMYKDHVAGAGKNRPSSRCLPHGIPDAMLIPEPFKIVHTPEATFILFEEFVMFRQVFTDGRPLPKDTVPTWLGYSVGMWEKGAFVVESAGFNDRSWLDDGGHPHSDALKTLERFRRIDFGHMTMQIEIDDPKTYAKTWDATLHFHLLPDTELMEFVCENEKDAAHVQ